MFTFFISVTLLVLGGVHYYFYRRLIVAPQVPAPWSTVAAVFLVLVTFSFPVSLLITRNLSPDQGRFLLYPLYTWLGVMLMLFFVLLGLDLVRLGAWLVGKVTGGGLLTDPGRRLALARLAAGTASATVLGAAAYGIYKGTVELVVRRVEVKLPRLPAALDGLKVAQLTDLHLGAMRRWPWLQKVVERTNGLGAHIIAVTGDLADTAPAQVPESVALLGKLKAPGGVFFVTGNHEYFHDLQGWLQALTDQGIRVLRNERVTVQKDGAALQVAGVDDHDGARMAPGHGPDLERALAGRDPNEPVLLLCHQPRIADEADRLDVDLTLTGHTHGGQIQPWGAFVRLQQPYVSGLHRHGKAQIYVSEGTGFWGPPMRVGSSSEITLVTLRRG